MSYLVYMCMFSYSWVICIFCVKLTCPVNCDPSKIYKALVFP